MSPCRRPCPQCVGRGRLAMHRCSVSGDLVPLFVIRLRTNSPCVFHGFVPDAPGWHFYHPTSCHVFPSQDVTFDESVPFYRLFPYRSTPPPPPPLFLAPGPPPVDPLPPQGPAPSGVSQPGGAESEGAETGGAEPGGVETGGADPGGVATGGAEPGGVATGGGKPGVAAGVEPGGVESEGAESGGAEPRGAASFGDTAGASLRLSLQQLREWFVRRLRLRSGASGAGDGGTGEAARAGVTGGTATAGPGGARTRGTGATGTGGPGGVATRGCEPGGAEPAGVEPGGVESEGAESGGAEPRGAASFGDTAGASLRLSLQQLREWFVRRLRLRSGASGAGDGGTGEAARAGVTGGTATAGPGGARTRGTGATGTGGVEGAGAGDVPESGTTGVGGAGVGGPGTGDAGAGGPGVGGVGAGGAGAVDPGGAVRPRPYFVPLLRQPASPLLVPSPCTEMFGSLTECREPTSRPVSPVRTARRVPRSRPPPVPCTHAMTLRPSSVPLRVPLPAPPKSTLPAVPDPESDCTHTASPTVSRLLATTVTDPSFESAAAFALVGELLEFAAACRLDNATALVVESASAGPPSVMGECALGTDVLEDRQEDFECLAAAVPHFASMLLALEGDPDAPDIPTPRSYAEAITACTRRSGCAAHLVSLSLRRPVYALRQAPREWHDTLRTTLAALGFAPATADPSLFLRTDTSLPPFYVIVYADDLVFAIVDTEELTIVKSEL
ncbi:unnamed protein product [Closterium sp. NIES-54]